MTTIHHTGLSNDTYTYHPTEKRPDGEEMLIYSCSVSIDGQVNGTLLFDDTINDPARICEVIVPAGKTLNINSDLTLGKINAYGIINLKSEITLNGTDINFYGQPLSIINIKGKGTDGFGFGVQASGSSVENCELFSINVAPNRSITIKKSKLIWI
ncbi:MAG: hypothetical protein ACP5JO_08740 [Candidatus Ratteibacteria bacterium]